MSKTENCPMQNEALRMLVLQAKTEAYLYSACIISGVILGVFLSSMSQNIRKKAI